MKRIACITGLVLALGLGATPRAEALDGFYLGGQVGATGPLKTATFGSAFGGGIELGFYANPIVELRVRGLYTNMGGTPPNPSVRLLAGTLSGEFHLLEVSDIELLFGVGPGFYSFSEGTTSESLFGIQGGIEVVLKLDEGVRIGFGFRTHAPLSAAVGTTLFTALVSVGYVFGG